MSKINYNKLPKDIAGQVELLEQRNLNISNKDKATKILSNISYARLSNYWYPYLALPKER